jgi:hypothetical protein
VDGSICCGMRTGEMPRIWRIGGSLTGGNLIKVATTFTCLFRGLQDKCLVSVNLTFQ